MPDYIQGSIDITAWLKKQGIEIEVDENTPVVSRWTLESTPLYQVYTRRHTARYFYYDYICPYFGPGGEGNCLKALRAWAKKNKYTLVSAQGDDGDIEWLLHCCEKHSHAFAHSPIGRCRYGKTDGEVLPALLIKLKEQR